MNECHVLNGSAYSTRKKEKRSGEQASNTCSLMESVFTSFQSFHFICSNYSLLEAQNTAYEHELIIAKGGSKRNDLGNTNWAEQVHKAEQTRSLQGVFSQNHDYFN